MKYFKRENATAEELYSERVETATMYAVVELMEKLLLSTNISLSYKKRRDIMYELLSSSKDSYADEKLIRIVTRARLELHNKNYAMMYKCIMAQKANEKQVI